MHPAHFDRTTLVGGAYHEVDPRICYVLVNFSQENIDGGWREFCREMGWGEPACEPAKAGWWKRIFRGGT